MSTEADQAGQAVVATSTQPGLDSARTPTISKTLLTNGQESATVRILGDDGGTSGNKGDSVIGTTTPEEDGTVAATRGGEASSTMSPSVRDATVSVRPDVELDTEYEDEDEDEDEDESEEDEDEYASYDENDADDADMAADSEAEPDMDEEQDIHQHHHQPQQQGNDNLDPGDAGTKRLHNAAQSEAQSDDLQGPKRRKKHKQSRSMKNVAKSKGDRPKKTTAGTKNGPKKKKKPKEKRKPGVRHRKNIAAIRETGVEAQQAMEREKERRLRLLQRQAQEAQAAAQEDTSTADLLPSMPSLPPQPAAETTGAVNQTTQHVAEDAAGQSPLVEVKTEPTTHQAPAPAQQAAASTASAVSPIIVISDDEDNTAAKQPASNIVTSSPAVAAGPTPSTFVSAPSAASSAVPNQQQPRKRRPRKPKPSAAAAASVNSIEVLDSDEELERDMLEEGFLEGSRHLDDKTNCPDEHGRVLVNVHRPKKEEPVFVAPEVQSVLKPHQIGGVRFMWDNVVESLDQYAADREGLGCILAHAMGLGKTLQVITFVEVFLRCTTARTAMIVVPVNTLQNWKAEFSSWLKESLPRLFIPSEQSAAERVKCILDWYQQGGVLVVGYEMLRNTIKANRLLERQPVEKPKTNVAKLLAALMNPGPDLVVCDEGHRVKNRETGLSASLKGIRTKRRIVLTGSPLQNNLEEYWNMVDFVRPYYLGTLDEFRNSFLNPIMNGQCVDSTSKDVELMRERSYVLYKRLESFVQRRTNQDLRAALPGKREVIILIRMTPIQQRIYQELLKSSESIRTRLFRVFSTAVTIWSHPDAIYRRFSATMQKQSDKKQKHLTQCLQKVQAATNETDRIYWLSQWQTAHSADSDNDDIDLDWLRPHVDNWQTRQLENGSKFFVLFQMLECVVPQNEKMLVFSGSLETLDVLETFLQDRQVPGTGQRWKRNDSYYRFDGSTPPAERQRLINAFNEPAGNASLFLLSTRAGSLGVNLTGANRVVILDSSWNPSHDAQAVCRIYRYGQTKRCFIYRLVAAGTMEEKIYQRQVSKTGLAQRIVDKETTERHYKQQDLEQLYQFEEPPPCEVDPHEFKDDAALSAVLHRCRAVIAKQPFEHDSLLSSDETEMLSEAEKQEALKRYIREKKRQSQPSLYAPPPPPPFPSHLVNFGGYSTPAFYHRPSAGTTNVGGSAASSSFRPSFNAASGFGGAAQSQSQSFGALSVSSARGYQSSTSSQNLARGVASTLSSVGGMVRSAPAQQGSQNNAALRVPIAGQHQRVSSSSSGRFHRDLSSSTPTSSTQLSRGMHMLSSALPNPAMPPVPLGVDGNNRLTFPAQPSASFSSTGVDPRSIAWDGSTAVSSANGANQFNSEPPPATALSDVGDTFFASAVPNSSGLASFSSEINSSYVSQATLHGLDNQVPHAAAWSSAASSLPHASAGGHGFGDGSGATTGQAPHGHQANPLVLHMQPMLHDMSQPIRQQQHQQAQVQAHSQHYHNLQYHPQQQQQQQQQQDNVPAQQPRQRIDEKYAEQIAALKTMPDNAIAQLFSGNSQ